MILRRAVSILVASASLSVGSLALSTAGTTGAGAAESSASLRTFCIDYQDFVTFTPTRMAEWKLQLSAVKSLVREAPGSMKSPMRSTANLIQTFINQNLHFTKAQENKAKSLNKVDQSKEKSLCKAYAGDG